MPNMRELVPETDALLDYEATRAIASLTVVITDDETDLNAGAPTGSGTSWSLAIAADLITQAMLCHRLRCEWALTDAGGWRAADVEYLEVVPYKTDHYGTFSGAHGRLPITLTIDSKPSLLDVFDELVAESRVIDARLMAAGRALPYANEGLLDHAAELSAAANILERLVIGRDPSPDKASTANVWRKHAEDIIKAVLTGRAVASATTGVFSAPDIFNAEALTIDDIA